MPINPRKTFRSIYKRIMEAGYRLINPRKTFLFIYKGDPGYFNPVFLGTLEAFDNYRQTHLQELEADLQRTITGSNQFRRVSLVATPISRNGIIDEEANPGQTISSWSRNDKCSPVPRERVYA